MPNGVPPNDEGLAKLEAFFARLEPALSDFASSRNLAIERYIQDEPSWSFLFRHPSGGTGKLDLERVAEDSVRLRRYWWKDDYDEGIRYLRSESQVLGSVRRDEIADALSLALDEVLAWDPSSLTPRGGMRDVWHAAFDEKSFRAMERRYSLPRTR